MADRVTSPRPALRLCDWDEFRAAWNSVRSVVEVAARLGITAEQATRLGCKMREAGVRLRRMRPGRRMVYLPEPLLARVCEAAAVSGRSPSEIMELAMLRALPQERAA